MPVSVSDANVYAMRSVANNLDVQTPLNLRLGTTKLCFTLRVNLPAWQSGVREIVVIMSRQSGMAS